MKLTVEKLILASSSPYRKKLMNEAGFNFITINANVDESAVSGESPEELAFNRACAKAMAVATINPGTLVIGCDQVLSLEQTTFDKALSAEEAATRLQSLQGRVHHLHSAFMIVTMHPDLNEEPQILRAGVISVPMNMRQMTATEIDDYIKTGEWQGSVGCYKAEGRGSKLFADMPQDKSAIIGLPMAELSAALRDLEFDGLLEPEPPWQITVQL